MHASELNPDPDLSIPALPVICERCKAEGAAGDDAFAGIPDILAFDPVPRRAHVNGWRPEHQRAFIAALAITGSPRAAARAIGKHTFGAPGHHLTRSGHLRVGIEAEAAFLGGALLITNEAAWQIVRAGLNGVARRIYGVSQQMLDYRLRVSGALKRGS